MSRPPIQSIKLSDELSLCECHPDSECGTANWWLHDKRADVNLGMREKTPEAAFIKTINYWAKRAQLYQELHDNLQRQVDAFVEQVRPAKEEDWPL
jgi:glucuronate isomerase